MNEYDLAEAFRKIEQELMESMIRNMARHRVEEIGEGYEWSMWQAEMLKSLEKYKRANRRKYGKPFKSINSQITALLREARAEGCMHQEIAILRAIERGWRHPWIPERIQQMMETVEGADLVQKIPRLIEMLKESRGGGFTGEFFGLNDQKLEALIKATKQDMERAETAILRKANDDYRKAIFNAQVYANTGAGTYEQAVDMATKDMLYRGLNCVEYANGARHTLADYADMAIRTASKRAYLQGEGEIRKEWGIHTVIMNKRGNPCPKCLPFCGKVLIDDVWSGGSADEGPWPLMSRAVEAGLYHPRCRDSHTTYFPGITTADGSWTEEELREIGLSNKREARQQYAERQAEKYGRLARYSLDLENQESYQKKADKWEKAKKSLLDWIGIGKILRDRSKDARVLAKDFYHNLLNVNDDDMYQLLRQSYKRVQFKPSRRHRSYFNRKDKTIYLARNASHETIAHELFHEIDRTYGITESGMLEKEIFMDYARLQRINSRKSLEDVLYLKYPEMFEKSAEELVVKPEYRGISDIIHGMTGGQVNLGYHHAVDYWERPGSLQRETWAQYGRMYYSENKEVLAVLKDIFPETTKEFERIIKAVTK